MKKIFLSMLALSLTFASFAQTENAKDQKQGRKEWKQKGGNDFQEKLNLTEAQKSQMKTLNESFRSKMQNLRDDKSLSADAQKQKRSALVKEHQSQVQAMLTTEQKKQWEESKKDFGERRGEKERGDMRGGHKGGHKKDVDAIAKNLNLSTEQTTRYKAANESFEKSTQSLRSNSTLSADAKKEQMKTLHKKHQEDINSILTDEQKAKYKSEFKSRKGRGGERITR